jgi:hypothetical protein
VPINSLRRDFLQNSVSHQSDCAGQARIAPLFRELAQA